MVREGKAEASRSTCLWGFVPAITSCGVPSRRATGKRSARRLKTRRLYRRKKELDVLYPQSDGAIIVDLQALAWIMMCVPEMRLELLRP